MKALVVDDEKQVAEVIAGFLRKKDITVDIACDLAEGTAKFRTVYDLVIMDISIKNELSFILLEKIKKESPHTVVVMSSGCDTKEYVEKARRLGADGFIPKPFKVEYLIEYLLPRIETLIAQRKISVNKSR